MFVKIPSKIRIDYYHVPEKRYLPCPASHFQLRGQGRQSGGTHGRQGRGSEPAEVWSQHAGSAFLWARTSKASQEPRTQQGLSPGPVLPVHDWPCLPFQLHLYSLPPVLHSASLEFFQIREQPTSMLPLGLAVPCCFLCQEYCCPRSALVFSFSSNVTS